MEIKYFFKLDYYIRFLNSK